MIKQLTSQDKKEFIKISVIAVVAFAGYIALVKAASDYGDRHFPMERFGSNDFWNWKSK